jgi:hypothetical protein
MLRKKKIERKVLKKLENFLIFLSLFVIEVEERERKTLKKFELKMKKFFLSEQEISCNKF